LIRLVYQEEQEWKTKQKKTRASEEAREKEAYLKNKIFLGSSINTGSEGLERFKVIVVELCESHMRDLRAELVMC